MTLTTDNRDKDEMLAYYEARIEALQERVKELERILKVEHYDCIRCGKSWFGVPEHHCVRGA